MKHNYNEDYYLAKVLQEKEKARERTRSRNAKHLEDYKISMLDKCKSNNKFELDCHLGRIGRIPWKNYSPEVATEIEAMENECKEAYKFLDQEISQVALDVKKAESFKSAGKLFGRLYGTKHDENLIRHTWKKYKIKHGTRLQEIADQINQPLKCFFCPSKEVLCKRCENKKTKK